MPPVLDPEGAHLASLRRHARFDHASVVEVGCGDGRLTSSLAEEAATIVAFDPEADAVATARRLDSAPPRARDALRRAGALSHAQAPRDVGT
jgi:16S rRNA A1518/A1519 N6-dimethyltransferase RsmA/KsgA/DIM1 with predicted DNA glycosylase/AP lyase activity